MPSATIEGTESRPDSGRYAPLCAVHYTSAQNSRTGEVACAVSQPKERVATQSNIDYGRQWRYRGAPVGFVYERARRRRSCFDRVLIRARRVRVGRVQVGGGSAGLLVPAMQRGTDLRYFGI